MMMQTLIAVWAGLGVVLTSASQLRVEGIPLGPGEVVLASWIMFVVFLLLGGAKFIYGRVFWVMAGYTVIAVILLAIGALVAIMLRENDRGAMHDAMAFTFNFTFACFLALRLYDDRRLYDHGLNTYHIGVAKIVFFGTVLFGGALLAAAMATSTLGPIELWYGGGYRFRGWAENPNQMGLFAAPMPFIGWYLLRRSQRLWHKVAYLLAIAVAIAIGIATRSDAYQVASLITFGGLGILAWYRAVLRGRTRWARTAYFVAPVLVSAAALSYGGTLLQHVEDAAIETYHDDFGQGEKRITLWLHGLEAIGRSPVFGFGPGSFSGYNGPFESREAHNTIIDWGMSTGILGIMLYLSLCVWCGLRCLRAGTLPLLGAVVVVFGASLFGYAMRHPLFWTTFVLVLALSEPRRLKVPAGPYLQGEAEASSFTLEEPLARPVKSLSP